MLTGVAVVPGTPLLEPAAAGAAAGELDELRAACAAAVRTLAATGSEAVVVVGTGPTTGELSAGARGDLAALALPDITAALHADTDSGTDADADAGSGADEVEQRLSRPLVLGVRLLDAVLPGVPRRAATVSEEASPAEAAALGERLVAGPRPIGLLVVGDGSAATVEASPAALVPGAVPVDREAARAVGSADLAAILALMPEQGERFVIEGRAPWQVAAGAALAVPDRGWRGELGFDAAPYGVTYLVATWT